MADLNRNAVATLSREQWDRLMLFIADSSPNARIICHRGNCFEITTESIRECLREGEFLHLDIFTMMAQRLNYTDHNPAVSIAIIGIVVVENRKTIDNDDLRKLLATVQKGIGTICVPILHESHYSLLVIRGGVQLTHFNSSDSSHGDNTKQLVPIINQDRIAAQIAEFVCMLLADKFPHLLARFKVYYNRKKLQQQHISSDCGFIALRTMELIQQPNCLNLLASEGNFTALRGKLLTLLLAKPDFDPAGIP